MLDFDFVQSALNMAMYFAALPLRVLYFHGPRLGGYGFQEGVSYEQACEKVTSVRSDFWVGSEGAFSECTDILERKFNAFVIGSFALATGAAIIHCIYVFSTIHAISPTAKKVDDILRHLLQDKRLT